MTEMSRKHAYALWAVHRGWYVFPCHRTDKTPRWEWSKDATNDADVVDRWWSRHREDNIGIAAKPSGLVVVDLDMSMESHSILGKRFNHGINAFEHIGLSAGQTIDKIWPWTHAVRTPKDGLHLYLKAPAEDVISNRPLLGLGGLIDIRASGGAHGGYVLGPGSTDSFGKEYRGNRRKTLAEIPTWLLNLLRDKPRAERPQRYVQGSGNWSSLANAVLTAAPGQRNAMLHWAALKVFEEGGSFDDAVEILLDSFLRTGEHHTEREALATIQSAYSHMQRKMSP